VGKLLWYRKKRTRRLKIRINAEATENYLLTAIEAPTRRFMIFILAIPYAFLIVAFAVGVWLSSGKKRALRVIAGLLVVYAVTGTLGSLVFPIHSRSVEIPLTYTDKMHIVFTFVGVLIIVLTMAVGAVSLRRQFSIYSIVTILLLIAGGVLTGLAAEQMQANLPTPWMGITERINIYATMLWIALLAIREY
jgi:hypothetical protein